MIVQIFSTCVSSFDLKMHNTYTRLDYTLPTVHQIFYQLIVGGVSLNSRLTAECLHSDAGPVTEMIIHHLFDC